MCTGIYTPSQTLSPSLEPRRRRTRPLHRTATAARLSSAIYTSSRAVRAGEPQTVGRQNDIMFLTCDRESVIRSSGFQPLALLALVFFAGCLDEPRFTVTFRDRTSLSGNLTALRECLPVSARHIVVNYDQLRGTRRGTFTFDATDESMSASINSSEVPVNTFVARHQSADWYPVMYSPNELSSLRVFRCENARALVAVNEGTGEGFFRER